MSELNDVEKKDQPSAWYKEAKGTLVYSLSELVFGSLLASFILGFIGFSSSILFNSNSISDTDQFTKITKVLTYLFISGTYTYYTAGLYLFYHTGILTMPTFNLKSARRDFSLSLLCAVAFGVSMLYPELLMSLLSLTVFSSLFIQKREHKKLVKKLYTRAKFPNDKDEDLRHESDYDKTKLNAIKNLLKTSKLEGWSNSVRWVWFWAFVLLVFGGMVFFYIKCDFTLISSITNIQKEKSVVILIVSVAIFLTLFFMLRKVFNLASTFNDPKSLDNYDTAYSQLTDDISKLKLK